MSQGLQATYFGANGWLLEFGALRVLVDPWLTGTLEFPPGPWLFRGSLPQEWPAPAPLDLLLLTQGLPDHCHPPSLALLNPDLPVVGSAAAARRAEQLGFRHVQALRPGERHCCGELEILATAGAPVPQVENGYRLQHPAGSLYLEPHGYLDQGLPRTPVDAVITPVVDLGLPLAGAFVRGRQVLPLLLERLMPSTVLASTAGGEVRFEGLLTRALWQRGSAAEAAGTIAARVSAARVSEATADTATARGAWSQPPRFIDPVPGEAYRLTGSW